ncbi:MAG: PAS domain S-box protein, partial [Calditrichaeota bacterium]
MRRVLKNIPFLSKWLLFGLLVLALVAGFTFGLVLPAIQAGYQEALARKARALARSIAPQAGAALYFQQIARLGNLLEAVTGDEDLAFLQIRDVRNQRVYGYRDLPFHKTVDSFLKHSAEHRQGRQIFYLKQNIFYNNQFQGILIAGFSRAWIATRMQRMKWVAAGFLGILSLLFLAGLWTLRQDAIVPLRQLMGAVRFLAAEEPGRRLDLSVDGADELGMLADKIRVLAHSLERNFRELNQSKKYIEAFFRLSPIPMLITDPMGRIEDANESAARFFESSRENLLNKNLETFLSADVNVVLNRVLKTTPDLKNYITSITTPRGSKRVIEINLSIVHDQYQMPKNLIVALVDITEKIQTQREILENQTKLHRMNRELVQKTQELQKAIEQNR